MRTRFEVLLVCTANVSRSPLAAALLRHHLIERFGESAATVRVTSSGTRVPTGAGTDPDVAELLRRLRRPAAPAQVARQLEEEQVRAADLVVTMTREHRSHVIRAVPVAQRRTFTALELARIARRLREGRRLPAGAPLAAGLRALVDAAPAWRGPTAPDDPAADDLVDVHGEPVEEQLRVARRLDEALRVVVDCLPAPQRSSGTGSSSVEATGW
ncbi:low molecular weight phosphatase family protein [Kineococcus sp. T13]|uniref:arsenate reductase/protein-tyrosine-phosphatase family protein n=1 Tax=Kineococcus vitellinus TaxID=2696565 RepID=UPI001412ADC4|nr:low molecular weight phosphatase family protein [Kineococcus vitellinus]